MHVIAQPVHCRLGDFRIPRMKGCAARAATDVIGSRQQLKGVAPGDFIPRSRDTCEVSPEGRELADPGDTGYVCDQLVHDEQGCSRRIDRRHRDHHQDRLVLSSRADVGAGLLGPSLIAKAGAFAPRSVGAVSQAREEVNQPRHAHTHLSPPRVQGRSQGRHFAQP